MPQHRQIFETIPLRRRQGASVPSRVTIFARLLEMVLIAGVLCPSARLSGQTSAPMPPMAARQPPIGHVRDPFQDEPDAQVRRKMEALRVSDREQRLLRDSHRLVLLTLDLKQQIAAAGGSTLTPEMQRRTQEIEKLARSIHQQMLQ